MSRWCLSLYCNADLSADHLDSGFRRMYGTIASSCSLTDSKCFLSAGLKRYSHVIRTFQPWNIWKKLLSRFTNVDRSQVWERDWCETVNLQTWLGGPFMANFTPVAGVWLRRWLKGPFCQVYVGFEKGRVYFFQRKIRSFWAHNNLLKRIWKDLEMLYLPIFRKISFMCPKTP